jgi:hypothetical protein
LAGSLVDQAPATTRCLRCGRVLTNPQSSRRGLGPDCFGKAPTARQRTMEAVVALVDDPTRGEAARGVLTGFHRRGLLGTTLHSAYDLLRATVPGADLETIPAFS